MMEKYITSDVLAGKMEVSKAMISKLLSDKYYRRTSEKNVVKLAKALNVQVFEIIIKEKRKGKKSKKK